jgi:hypothetical protein
MALIEEYDAGTLKNWKRQGGSDSKVIDYFTKEGCMSGIMKDSEWDARVSKSVEGVLLSEALNELGIDEDDVREIKPARLWGPMNSAGGLHKYNEAAEYVAACIEVTWILFGDEQLYVFEKQTDLSGLNDPLVYANEFFYKDVVSISTKQEKIKIKDEGGNLVDDGNTYTQFVLTVPGDQIRCTMYKGQDQVQAMKQKLREKKRS